MAGVPSPTSPAWSCIRHSKVRPGISLSAKPPRFFFPAAGLARWRALRAPCTRRLPPPEQEEAAQTESRRSKRIDGEPKPASVKEPHGTDTGCRIRAPPKGKVSFPKLLGPVWIRVRRSGAEPRRYEGQPTPVPGPAEFRHVPVHACSAATGLSRRWRCARAAVDSDTKP